MNDLARERMIYESLTDDDLKTPLNDLHDGKKIVLEHVLRGPYGEELMERIAALGGVGDE